MKKITLALIVSFTFSLGQSQTNLFYDDFESYTDFVISGFGNWLTLDLDGLNTYTGGVDSPTYPNAGSAMAYQIFNPSTTTPSPVTNESNPANGEVRNFDPHSGAKYAGAWAAVPAAPVTANDDWLISPAITLAASGNTASFWVKALSNTYGDENYTVGVYTGSGTPTGSGDFTLIGGTRTATYPAWEQVTIDLSAYNDQTVRIGIHCISSDRYLFMVDDFSVDTTLGVNEFTSNNFKNFYDKNSDALTLLSSVSPLSSVQIYSVLGQEIINKNLSQSRETVNLSDIEDGVYIVRVTINDQTTSFKLLKQ